MSNGIEVRGYLPGDEEKIIDLLKIVFNGWPHFDTSSPADYWKWKYSDDTSKKLMALAVDGNNIVATFLTQTFQLKICETILHASNGVDVAVDPKYRGLGLFNKTRDLIGNHRKTYGLKIHVGISDNPIVVKNYEKNSRDDPIHWPKFPFTINRLIRIRDLDEYLKKNPVDHSIIKKVGYTTLSDVYKIRSRLEYGTKKPSSIKLREINHFSYTADEFWENIKESYDFILERKSEYLNWRYCDQRAGNYRIIQAEEGGRVVGYSILRINRYKPENLKGFIVDLIAVPRRMDVADALLEDGLRYFDNSRINAMFSLSYENDLYSRLYKDHGFITYAKPKLFLWLTEDLGEIIQGLQKSKPKRAHIAYGDEDEI